MKAWSPSERHRRPAPAWTAGLLLALAMAAAAPGLSARGGGQVNTPAPQQSDWTREDPSSMWSVSPREGLYLYDLIVKHHLKRGLEIGTSNGYSGVWIASGMKVTRGHLLTLEFDPASAELARDNFQAARVDRYVTLQEGDARKALTALPGPFDFVFIDAAKSDYLDYLEMVLPKVSPGGVIVAHHVIGTSSELRDFIHRIETDPQLRTRIVKNGGGGFSVSFKVRKRKGHLLPLPPL